MISDKFVILGALITLGGDLSYVRDTLSGRAMPNRVTWLLWGLAPLIAFAAELDKHIGLVALMTLSIGIGPLVVFVASFFNRKSHWKLGWHDYICGALSLLGLVLWLSFNDGNIAVVLSILADLMAGTPTIIKSFNHPQSETSAAYWAPMLSAVITLLAIQHWTIASAAFPVYILVISVIFVALIQFKLGLKLSRRAV